MTLVTLGKKWEVERNTVLADLAARKLQQAGRQASAVQSVGSSLQVRGRVTVPASGARLLVLHS